MKRLLSLLLSLLMLLTLFGCSNSGNTGGNGGSAAGDKAGAPGQEFPEREQLTFWLILCMFQAPVIQQLLHKRALFWI